MGNVETCRGGMPLSHPFTETTTTNKILVALTTETEILGKM